jgi:hypothetical protein
MLALIYIHNHIPIGFLSLIYLLYTYFSDIDECKRPDLYPCSSDGICKNRPLGYDCPCKPGMKGDGKAGTCQDVFPIVAKMVVGKHTKLITLIHTFRLGHLIYFWGRMHYIIFLRSL